MIHHVEKEPGHRAFQLFSRSINNERTREDYEKVLKQFLQFCNLTNIEEILYTERECENKIIDFLLYQSDRGLSKSYINKCFCGIRRFYEINDYDLKWTKIKRFVSSKQKRKKDRPYAREELQGMMEHADLREKIIITLCSSSGIRIGALPFLKIGHLEPIAVQGFTIYKLRIYEGEVEEYITYCSVECRKYIDEYLSYRQRYGEVIHKDSPLIREEFNTKKKDGASIQPKQMAYHWIRQLMRKLKKLAGVPSTEIIYENHGLRKFFDTTCTKSGVNTLFVEMMMGHKLAGMKSHYFKPTESDLLEGNDKMLGYLAAITELTINDENRLEGELGRVNILNKNNEAIIKGKLQEKDDELRKFQQKYEKDMESLRNEMQEKFQEFISKIDTTKI